MIVPCPSGRRIGGVGGILQDLHELRHVAAIRLQYQAQAWVCQKLGKRKIAHISVHSLLPPLVRDIRPWTRPFSGSRLAFH